MPQAYENVRDECYERKRKNGGGRLTKKDRQDCKKMAAIWYVKKYGKPVKHEKGSYFVINGENAILKDLAKPLSVIDYDIIVPIENSDLEKLELVQAQGMARAATFIAKDIVIGDTIESVGLSKADITNDLRNAYKELSARIVDDEIEKNKTEPDKIIDEFLPNSDESKQRDLMYVSFKMVHAGGNENKDFFVDEDLQAAQFTPMLKPLNWEHGEPNIGTIYLSKYVAATENEPAHIKCAAAIYKYKYPDYAKEMANRYNNDNLFFSMEVWFTEFECSTCHNVYAFKDLEICKHLQERWSGGSDTFRILHNLTFAGAGVVENPADKLADSISIAYVIKTPIVKDSDTDDKEIHNNSNEKEGENMDVKTYSSDEINAMIDEKTGPLQAKIDEIKSSLDNVTEEKDQALAEITTLKTDLEDRIKELDDAKAELDKIRTEYEKYKNDIEGEKTLATRLAELVELDVEIPEDEAEADKFMERVKNADDNSFALLKDALLLKSVQKTVDIKNTSDDSNDDSGNSDASDDNSDTNADDNVADIPVGAGVNVSNKLSDVLSVISTTMRGNNK